jgi:microcystin-dependent protein
MSNYFVGEIRMFGGNSLRTDGRSARPSVAISGTKPCTSYWDDHGGDGQTTFNLPNPASRPIHAGQGPGISQTYILGQTLGVEQVTLTTAQIPSHTHTLSGSSDIATNPSPGGNILATSSLLQPYVGIAPDANMAANAIAPSGGSTPHDNMMPFLCISFIIALSGIFPSQR